MHTTFTLKAVRQDNYRTRTLIFDRSLPATPGQFVMAWLPGKDERPYSIAGDDPLSLTVVAVGPFSQALSALQPGQQAWIRGPLGQGFTLQGQRLLLVGGGYGVAPLLFLAQRAQLQGCALEVCIGARTAEDILLSEAFAELGATVRLTTEDGSRGETGRVTAALAASVAAQPPDCVYACGPVPMLEAVQDYCLEHGLPHQLSWEAHMRCGVGLCGSCEVHAHPLTGWLACLDGPVSQGP